MNKEFRPDPGEKRYTFDDVQGVDEAKAEVQEIVEFLKNPEKFQRLGAKLPTGKLRTQFYTTTPTFVELSQAIIESVDSISRDGPEVTFLYVIHYKN